MSPYVRRRLALSNVTWFKMSSLKFHFSLKLSCHLFSIWNQFHILVSKKIKTTHAASLLQNRSFMQKDFRWNKSYLIPCGGSLVYFKDIWRRPIGKFLFTSVVIHNLVCVIVSFKKRTVVFLMLPSSRVLAITGLTWSWRECHEPPPSSSASAPRRSRAAGGSSEEEIISGTRWQF